MDINQIINKRFEFEGTDIQILLGFISLYQKYNHIVCFPIITNNILSISWNNGQDLIIPDDLWSIILNCDKNITAFPLILDNEDDIYSHMNMLIYDKKRQELQRFDPNGKMEMMDDLYNTFLLDEKIKFEVYDNLGNYTEYVPADNTCPIQILQENQESSEGYCAAWSLWYLELRLSNLNVDPYTLEQQAYNKLKNNDDLLTFIKGYLMYIINMNDYIILLVNNKYNTNITELSLNDNKVISVIKQLLPIDEDLINKLCGLHINS